MYMYVHVRKRLHVTGCTGLGPSETIGTCTFSLLFILFLLTDSHSSAPATPTKAKEGGFRRSLSFGANNPGSGKSACVVARPCE